MTVDTGVDFGQFVITAVVIDDLLDLLSVELLIGEDGQVGGERADNTVAAEDCDPVVRLFQGADKVIDIGGLLGEASFILKERLVESS